MHLIKNIRSVVSQTRRLRCLGLPWSRWPLLLAELRLPIRLAGVRARAEGGVLRVSVPGGRCVITPLQPSGSVWATLRETVVWHWRPVALLDQYDAGRALRPGMVAVDVGANVGCFTMLASRLVGDDGLVIAIEPVEANFACLERTIEENGLRNVRTVRAAVGDHNGEVRLSLSEQSGQHSGVFKRGDTYATVPSRTLDSIVADLGLDHVDFVKVDVEGMEPQVLRGAAGTIQKFLPRLAVSAYHLPDHREVLPATLRALAPNYRACIRALAFGLEDVMFASPADAGG